MKRIFLLLLIMTSWSVASIECTAKVANRTYRVSMDTQSRELQVDVDTGSRYHATANFFHSKIRNAHIWSIPAGYNAAGLEFVYDIAGNKYWVCLSASECYICR